MEKDQIKQVVLSTLETSLRLQIKAIQQMTGEDQVSPAIRRRGGKRRQSIVDLSVNLLTETGTPLHVTEICKLLMQNYGRITDRDSLSSALAKKARQGILFHQIAPATFDLIDREGRHE